MTTLDVTPEGQFILRCSPRYRDRAAQVPGLRYSKQEDAWLGHACLAIAMPIRSLFPDVEVSNSAYSAVASEHERAMSVEEWKGYGKAEKDHPLVELGLFPEQVPASACASLQGGFIIGDEKGSGKTVEALGALLLEKAAGRLPVPCLIVCTTSMLHTWEQAVSDWTPFTPAVAGRTPTARKAAIAQIADGSAQVLIMSYAQMRLHSSLAGYGSVALTDKDREPKELNLLPVPFASVIVDEAHRLKDPKSKQTRAIKKVSASARLRLALTATPVKGNTLDLWSVLHFTDPDTWRSKSKFRDRYVSTYTNHWGRVEDMGLNPSTEAEFRRLFDAVFIRRKLELPVAVLEPQHRFLDLDGKQRTQYRQLERESMTEQDGEFLVAVGPLTLNTRLQQAAQATLVIEDGAVTSMSLPSCKYDALCDLLDEMGGDPLVVFSESRLLLELCYRELTTGRSPRFTEDQIGRVDGTRSASERAQDIRSFQEGNLPLILCSLGAGSEGITLTASNTVCFLNRSYDQVANSQAEGRVYRIGQTRDVQVIDFIARETDEFKVYEANRKKDLRMQEIVQDDDWQELRTPAESPEAWGTFGVPQSSEEGRGGVPALQGSVGSSRPFTEGGRT